MTTNTALELVQVPFHGDTLVAGKDDSGNVWVSIASASDGLGIDSQGQTRKLREKPWAGVELISTPSQNGGIQATWCIPLRALPMWLATIEASRVKPTLREKLELYQKEAADVLAKHFLGAQRVDVSPMDASLVRQVIREEIATVLATMAPRKTKPRVPEQEDFLQAPLHAPLLIALELLAREINPHEGTIMVSQLLAEINSPRRAGCPVRIAIAQHLAECVAHKGVQSIEIRVGRYLGTLLNRPPHDGRVVFKEVGMTTRWGVRRVSMSIVAA